MSQLLLYSEENCLHLHSEGAKINFYFAIHAKIHISYKYFCTDKHKFCRFLNDVLRVQFVPGFLPGMILVLDCRIVSDGLSIEPLTET